MARIGVQILQRNISLMPNNLSFIVLVNKRYMNTGIRMTIHNSQINIHNVNWIYSTTIVALHKGSFIQSKTLSYHDAFTCIFKFDIRFSSTDITELKIILVPGIPKYENGKLTADCKHDIRLFGFENAVPKMITRIKNVYVDLYRP